MRGIIIPADIHRPIIAVDVRDNGGILLADIVGMVGGFERVRIGDWRTREQFGTPEHWVIMIVDDNGSVIGKPVNARASILYGAPIHGGAVYGDALLLGEHEVGGSGDFTELPAPFADPYEWTGWFTEAAEALS